ncbi:MAG: hypothetical protein NC093_02240 [Alistipes sp.]|nr:hypothetical protein [Alistipes sp.]
MKKLLSITAACLLLCSVTSCSEASEDTGSAAENLTQMAALKSADINMADDFDLVICNKSRKNDILIFGRLRSGEYGGYITNSEFSEKRSFIFEPQENEEIKSAALSEIGKSAVLTVLDGETFIYIFNRDGNLTDTINCGELISESDYFADIISCDEEFYIALSHNTLVFADENGNISENSDVTNKIIYGLFNNSEGVPCVLFSSSDKLTLAGLDRNGITEQVLCDDIGSTINAVGTGAGEHQLSAVCSDGLYGLKEGKWLKIADFSENDFNAHNIISVIMTAENEYVITLHNDDMTYEMRLLSERDISEINQKKIIKMANVTGGNMDIYDPSIKKFNSENEEYKIEMINYASDEIDYEQTINALELDILAGNAPDIVRFIPDIPGTYFVDLYSLLDNDPELRRSDFVEGFLEGIESDGRLLRITPTFSINTLCIKDKFAEGLKEWDLGQLDSICKKKAGDMGVISGEDIFSRTDMFMQLFNYREFADLKNASCNFDSTEFIDRMKFMNDNQIGCTGSTDGCVLSADEQIFDFRNDRYLLINARISSYRDLKIYEQVYGGEACTFIGCPSDNGNGSYCSTASGYSIMADSQYVDGAWDFLKYYLFEEDDASLSGFSALESKLSDELEYHKTLQTYEDPETGEQENIDLYAAFEPGSSEPMIIALEPFSDKKAAEYSGFVHNAVKNSCAADEEIRNILKEEMTYYFEGERSAEETANIIQNRVSIYVSEIN